MQLGVTVEAPDPTLKSCLKHGVELGTSERSLPAWIILRLDQGCPSEGKLSNSSLLKPRIRHEPLFPVNLLCGQVVTVSSRGSQLHNRVRGPSSDTRPCLMVEIHTTTLCPHLSLCAQNLWSPVGVWGKYSSRASWEVAMEESPASLQALGSDRESACLLKPVPK